MRKEHMNEQHHMNKQNLGINRKYEYITNDEWTNKWMNSKCEWTQTYECTKKNEWKKSGMNTQIWMNNTIWMNTRRLMKGKWWMNKTYERKQIYEWKQWMHTNRWIDTRINEHTLQMNKQRWMNNTN